MVAHLAHPAPAAAWNVANIDTLIMIQLLHSSGQQGGRPFREYLIWAWRNIYTKNGHTRDGLGELTHEDCWRWAWRTYALGMGMPEMGLENIRTRNGHARDGLGAYSNGLVLSADPPGR
eukprot:1158565-Pelagomonas_calceolata.AAC.4